MGENRPSRSTTSKHRAAFDGLSDTQLAQQMLSAKLTAERARNTLFARVCGSKQRFDQIVDLAKAERAVQRAERGEAEPFR